MLYCRFHMPGLQVAEQSSWGSLPLCPDTSKELSAPFFFSVGVGLSLMNKHLDLQLKSFLLAGGLLTRLSHPLCSPPCWVFLAGFTGPVAPAWLFPGAWICGECLGTRHPACPLSAEPPFCMLPFVWLALVSAELSWFFQVL